MATANMVCLYCRRKIGFLRSLTDPSFCCADHRKKLSTKSARALREAEDLYGFDDLQIPLRTVTNPRPEERRAGFGATIFFATAIVAVLLVLARAPAAAPVAHGVSTLPSTQLNPDQGGLSQLINNLIQKGGSATLHDDFRS